MVVLVRVGRRNDPCKDKGEGRKPARTGKTKKQAAAEVIERRAGKKDE